jgi:hypothetical protein
MLLMSLMIPLVLPINGGCAKEASKEPTNTVSKGKSMSLLMNKPVFSLKVNVFGVGNFIKANGVTVTFDTSSSSQTTVTLPVNHWIRSGENSIGFNLYPPKPGHSINPNSFVEIDLTVHELNDPKKVYTVATLHFKGTQDANKSYTGKSSPSGIYSSVEGFKPNKNGDVQVFDVEVALSPAELQYEGAMKFVRKINIPSSLPLWAFFNSEEMPDYRAMYHQDEDKYDKAITPLYTEYEKVQKALAKKDIQYIDAHIMPMFEERNRELDLAFYLEPGTTKEGLRQSFLSTFKDMNEGNEELLDLDVGSVDYQLESNKKIVSLVRRGMVPAIVINYVNELKGAGSERLNMLFRYQNGKYILTR